MSKKFYVFSTMATDVRYGVFAPNPDGTAVPRVEHSVVIMGGAGVANDRLETPKGVSTVVSEEELQMLQDNDIYKQHVKNGFITVEEKNADADEVGEAMNQEEKSRQPGPGDFADTAVEGVSAAGQADEIAAPPSLPRRK